jgi:hypothetical protein
VATTPGPTPTLVAGTDLPPPPHSFDPASLRWVGDASNQYTIGTLGNGVWVGAANGVGVVVTDDPSVYPTVVAGQSYYLSGEDPDNPNQGIIWHVEDNLTPHAIATGGRFAIAAEAGVVAVRKRAIDDSDAGVWLVGLDGGDAEQVIPTAETQRGTIAISSDGRRVASGYCEALGEGVALIDLWAGGQLTRLPVIGQPLGFDEEGRLVYAKQCGPGSVGRVDEERRTETLVDSPFSQARVTPDGRYLLTWEPTELARNQGFRIIELATKAEWSTTFNGTWTLSQMGDSTYAVLEGLAPGATDIYVLVISLRDHWFGALPPIASLAAGVRSR